MNKCMSNTAQSRLHSVHDSRIWALSLCIGGVGLKVVVEGCVGGGGKRPVHDTIGNFIKILPKKFK